MQLYKPADAFWQFRESVVVDVKKPQVRQAERRFPATLANRGLTDSALSPVRFATAIRRRFGDPIFLDDGIDILDGGVTYCQNCPLLMEEAQSLVDISHIVPPV